MAEDLEVLPPEHEEEEGGGPVKSFLEHLEDLRWTLLKCALALALGMILALSASPYIVWFLKWPLVLAQRVRTSPEARVALIVGTNILAKLPASQFPVPGLASNRDVVLRMVPISGASLGIPGASNLVLSSWVLDPNPPESATYGMNVDLKTMGPIESFSVAIKIGLYGGVAISAPFVVDTAEQDSILEPTANSGSLARRIPGAQELRRNVGHFTYVPECKALVGVLLARAAGAPICDDPRGVDRAALHRDAAAAVVRHFNVHLRAR